MISYRTYRVCGQDPSPCDQLTGNSITDGGHITLQLDSASETDAEGSIVSSADPAYPVGARVFLALDSNDALNVQIDETLFAIFCGESSPVGFCGA